MIIHTKDILVISRFDVLVEFIFYPIVYFIDMDVVTDAFHMLYMVKPMGGCQKVIETTKAFRQLQDFHTLESMGIVDRDRRTQGEIDYLHDQHIFVPDVAEVSGSHPSA